MLERSSNTNYETEYFVPFITIAQKANIMQIKTSQLVHFVEVSIFTVKMNGYLHIFKKEIDQICNWQNQLT